MCESSYQFDLHDECLATRQPGGLDRMSYSTATSEEDEQVGRARDREKEEERGRRKVDDVCVVVEKKKEKGKASLFQFIQHVLDLVPRLIDACHFALFVC